MVINNKTDLSAALRVIHKYQVMEAEAKAAKAAIKEYMEKNALDTVTAGGFNATVKTVNSVRLDQKALKANEPKLYEQYSINETTTRLYIK